MIQIKENPYEFWSDFKYIVVVPKEIAMNGYMQTMDGDHPIVSKAMQKALEICGSDKVCWQNPSEGEGLAVAFMHLGQAKTFSNFAESCSKNPLLKD